jgi:DNA-binding HxlR family transcriptional regulator
MKRKSLEGNLCAIARALDVIGDWWSLLIVRDAMGGLRRFGEFQKNLGLAKNILSARLKTLVERGIMENVPASDGSAYQEYQLTEQGRALLPVFIALGQWSSEFLFEPGELGSVAVDAEKKQPLRKLELRAEAGHMLHFDDIHIAREPFIINTGQQNRIAE